MILRDAKKRQTEDLLYEEALGLFRSRGFEAVSVDEIAAAANVCRRTFFNYFPSKDHLLARFHREITQAAVQYGRATSERGLPAIFVGLSAFGRLATAEREIGKALLRVMFASDVLQDQDEQDVELLREWLMRELEYGAKSGQLRCRDLDEVAGLTMGVLSSTVIQWVVSGGRATDDLTHVLVERFTLLVQGIGSSGYRKRKLKWPG